MTNSYPNETTAVDVQWVDVPRDDSERKMTIYIAGGVHILLETKGRPSNYLNAVGEAIETAKKVLGEIIVTEPSQKDMVEQIEIFDADQTNP